MNDDTFFQLKYNGAADYRDRTAMKRRWRPGEVKLVTQRDARRLLQYNVFAKVMDDAATKSQAQADTQSEEAQAVLMEEEAQAEKLANKEAVRAMVLAEIENMDKATLEQYAKDTFQVDLDRRRSEANLREDVRQLVETYNP